MLFTLLNFSAVGDCRRFSNLFSMKLALLLFDIPGTEVPESALVALQEIGYLFVAPDQQPEVESEDAGADAAEDAVDAMG